jgi:hypothetical protein
LSELLFLWFDKLSIIARAVMAWLFNAANLELNKLGSFISTAIEGALRLFNSALSSFYNFSQGVFVWLANTVSESVSKVFSFAKAAFFWFWQALGKCFSFIKNATFWLAEKFNPNLSRNMSFLNPIAQAVGFLFMGFFSFWLGIGAIRSIQKKIKKVNEVELGGVAGEEIELDEGLNNFQAEAKLDVELAAHSVVATGCFITSCLFAYKTAQACSSILAAQDPCIPDLVKSIGVNLST